MLFILVFFRKVFPDLLLNLKNSVIFPWDDSLKSSTISALITMYLNYIFVKN